ncbi:MAG: hypothetical protein FWE41_04040 [Coriobacteriia bacterium]|nr:hypothetical protein [Coriobacteriia bacterium]
MFHFDQGQIGTLTPSPCSTNPGHQPRPSCTTSTVTSAYSFYSIQCHVSWMR